MMCSLVIWIFRWLKMIGFLHMFFYLLVRFDFKSLDWLNLANQVLPTNLSALDQFDQSSFLFSFKNWHFSQKSWCDEKHCFHGSAHFWTHEGIMWCVNLEIHKTSLSNNKWFTPCHTLRLNESDLIEVGFNEIDFNLMGFCPCNHN